MLKIINARIVKLIMKGNLSGYFLPVFRTRFAQSTQTFDGSKPYCRSHKKSGEGNVFSRVCLARVEGDPGQVGKGPILPSEVS